MKQFENIIICLFLSFLVENGHAIVCNCPYKLDAFGYNHPGYVPMSTSAFHLGWERVTATQAGLTVVAITGNRCDLQEAVTRNFDTHWQYSASQEFVDYMGTLSAGTKIFLFTEDDFSYRIQDNAKELLVTMGAPFAEPEYRSALALVTIANGDGTYNTVDADYNEDVSSEVYGILEIDREYDPDRRLNQFGLQGTDLEPTESSLTTPVAMVDVVDCMLLCMATTDCQSFVFRRNSDLNCALYSCVPLMYNAVTGSSIYSLRTADEVFVDIIPNV